MLRMKTRRLIRKKKLKRIAAFLSGSMFSYREPILFSMWGSSIRFLNINSSANTKNGNKNDIHSRIMVNADENLKSKLLQSI